MEFQTRGRLDDLRWIAVRTVFAIVCVVPATVVLALLFHGSDLAGPNAISAALRCAIEISIVQGVALCAIISTYDLSLLRRSARAQGDLEQLARTDQLTGLLNRRGFDAMLAREIGLDLKLARPAAALMCDLDFFKSINDHHGHAFGDAVLKSLAALLREFTEGRDVVLGRQGGEEFVALIHGVGPAQAEALARSIREACASRAVVVDGEAASITISIGVAAAKAGEMTPSGLIARADAALYEAKRAGRDRVAVAPPGSRDLAA